MESTPSPISGKYRPSRLLDISADRNNNLNLIRLFAASLVVFSHSWPLGLGRDDLEPILLAPFTFFGEPFRYTSGIFAVQVFFILSGFLITQSFARSSSLIRFILARTLRLFPALIVVNLFCVFILGPIFTSVPVKAYLAEPHLRAFLIENTIFTRMIFNLPGVFTTNPYPNVVNGCLWSLPHEMFCYLTCFVFGILGLYRSHLRSLFFVALSALSLYLAYAFAGSLDKATAGTSLMPPYLRFLGTSFFIGQAFYCFRSFIPYNLPLLIFAVIGAFVSGRLGYTSIVFNLLLAYSLFGLAFIPRLVLNRFNSFPDISYGVYLYGFPVQQAVAALSPGFGVAFFFLVSFIITALLALISAILIEQPYLKLVRKKASDKAKRAGITADSSIAPEAVPSTGT